MERLDGASTLPVMTDKDQALLALQIAYEKEEITREEYEARKAQIMDAHAAAVAMLTSDGWDAGAAEDIVGGVERREGGLDGWFERSSSPAARAQSQKAAREGAAYDARMDGFDRDMGIAMGQIDPEAETAELPLAPPEDQEQYWYLSPGQRLAQVGAPWGSTEAFKNDFARDQYYERPPVDPNAEDAMRERGVPEKDIRRARLSQQDIDMMEPGRASDQGWAMVYAPGHDGRAVPRQRAPAPSAMDEQTGLPNPQTNLGIISGGRRVGERVDNRELSPELRNESLERQGYVPTLIQGPNGPEWVYELSDGSQPLTAAAEAGLRERGATDEQIAALTGGVKEYNRNYTNNLMQRQSMQRLRDQAPGAPVDASADQLRQLISQTRAADKAERTAAYRRSQMNPRMRAEMGLEQLDDPNLNEWQRLVLAQNLAPKVDGTTPLAANAFMNEQMLRAMQAQMTGRGFTGGAEVALGMATLQNQERLRTEAKLEEWRALAADYRGSAFGAFWTGGNRERARTALQQRGVPPAMQEQILNEVFPPEQEAKPADGGGTGPGGLRLPAGATPYRYGM